MDRIVAKKITKDMDFLEMMCLLERPRLLKMVHMMWLVSEGGDVSPLCAKVPKALKLDRSTWTLLPKLVTCQKCLKAMEKDDWMEKRGEAS